MKAICQYGDVRSLMRTIWIAACRRFWRGHSRVAHADRPVLRIANAVVAVVCTSVALPAAATDREQFWPEFNAVVKLDDQQRLLFVASETHEQDVGPIDLLLSANYDHALKQPASGILHDLLPSDPGTGSRYIWVRLGIRHVASVGAAGPNDNENSALAELSARYALGGNFSFVPRLRADLRNINGGWSERARLRGTIEKNTQIFGVPISPYVEAELFYDTRYNAISRQLYQMGADFPLAKRWRVEPYVALQKNSRGSSPHEFRALGLVLKTDF